MILDACGTSRRPPRVALARFSSTRRTTIGIIAACCFALPTGGARSVAAPPYPTLRQVAAVRLAPAYLPDDARPAIHGPSVIGCSPGRRFLYRIPATGAGPLTFSANGLPRGLTLDSRTGTISGSVTAAGTSSVELVASNGKERSARALRIVCGEGKSALTPPMGWQSFGLYGDAVTDAQIRDAADGLVKTGLAAHGYQYVNVGDSWQGGRDAAGNLHPNRRFPDMKALGDYIHNRGLKFGLYSAVTAQTCSGFAGSEGHEAQDAAVFASWGVDYLAFDWCPDAAGVRNVSAAELQAKFLPMGTALEKTDRDIVYAVSVGKRDPEPTDWAGKAKAATYERQGGLYDDRKIIHLYALVRRQVSDRSGPGHWDSLGPLFVGRIGFPKPRLTKLTTAEQMTQMTLWCLLSSPLFISSDLTHLDPNLLNHYTTSLLTNDEVLAVDQDPKGETAIDIGPDYSHLIWKKPLSDGRVAVALFNDTDGPAWQSVSIADLGLSGKQPVRDLWMRRDLDPATDKFSAVVPAHGVVFIAVGRAAADTR